MDKADYEKVIEILARKHKFTGLKKKGFIKTNLDYVLRRSYFRWNEKAAIQRYEFLDGEYAIVHSREEQPD